jgi:phosphotriesterase-related protein
MEKDNDLDLKIILWLILFLVFGIIIICCKPGPHGSVITVTGLKSPEKLGLTLEHEHVLVDFIGADSTGSFRWNRDSVIVKILPFIIEAKKRGVNTIIDCTPEWLGRDPVLLKELSEKSGVLFLTNTGYYGARKNLFIPKSFYTESADKLAEKWINEFYKGIEGTGIRPGFIKIGVDPDSLLSPEHIKLITAAALTHLKTGLVIESHTGPDSPAFEQLEILREKGVSPSAFIWVHAQRGTPEGNIRAAKMGAWISLDNVHRDTEAETGSRSPYSIEWYAERIVELKKAGVLGKVLLSHDSGWYDPAKPGGGKINGYTAIFDYLIPVLKSKGLSDMDVNQILVENPKVAFRIKVRRF